MALVKRHPKSYPSSNNNSFQKSYDHFDITLEHTRAKTNENKMLVRLYFRRCIAILATRSLTAISMPGSSAGLIPARRFRFENRSLPYDLRISIMTSGIEIFEMSLSEDWDTARSELGLVTRGSGDETRAS
jgi:hypothetical protein